MAAEPGERLPFGGPFCQTRGVTARWIMLGTRQLAWVLVLSMFACAATEAGCAVPSKRHGVEGLTGDETDPDGDLLGDTTPATVCPGECTPEPQLPFNSRIHLIW